MQIDLSVIINEQTPVYPGDKMTRITLNSQFESEGYEGRSVSLSSHVGTHIDAPAHMVKGGATLDSFPLDKFVGDGKLIDVTDGSYEKVKSADIQEGEIVIFRSGMSEKYHDPIYFTDFPAMPVEIARFLVEKKVKMVGLDTCSADNQDGFPIHKMLLGAGILIIENLTGLDRLVGEDFRIFALPIKLQIDGAPARVIAEIKR